MTHPHMKARRPTGRTADHRTRPQPRILAGHALAQAALCSLIVGASPPARAVRIDTEVPDLQLRWDNTIKLSGMARLDRRADGLSTTRFGPSGIVGPNNINQDDGDNNFGRGLVSSRLDLLSEADVGWRDVGARLSAAAWYDPVYRRRNDNTTTTSNQSPSDRFADETRRVMGGDAELLDAFVWGRTEIGGHRLSARAGRHTLLWGESLFFGANGVAGGMAPMDLVKLLSVPNSQFKETARPTGKLSAQLALSEDVSLGAFIGYEWEKTQLMPAGAYLSGSDSMGPGAERISAGATGTFSRRVDQTPGDGGQYGLQLRWNAPDLDTQFGLYALRWHATTPSNIVTTMAGTPGALSADSYQWLYHRGIETLGFSAARTVGAWSLAAELSWRRNAPLASAGQTAIPAIGVGSGWNNDEATPYAVGETAHAQFSWIASLGPNAIAQESSFVGEIAFNTRLKTTRNAAMLNPNADRSATGVRMVWTPTYRQALPGLDLSPSVGAGWTWGKSSAVGPGFGVDRGGDLSLGLSATYLGGWTAALSYVRYLGPEGAVLDNANNAQFTQALKDRDFLSLSLRSSF
ncbi:MAG: hypothetical protein RLY78_2932 [Pseudomonadota bacterium]